MKQSISSYTARFLELNDIKTGFGVGGGYIDPLLYEISESSELQFYLNSSETGAGYMADGYARVSGKPAFLITTAGPGETNTITALANMLAEHIPVFFLSGHVPLYQMGRNSFQDNSILSNNINEIISNVSNYSSTVYNSEEFVYQLRNSYFKMMKHPRGPVHLTLPYDILDKKISVKDSFLKMDTSLNPLFQFFDHDQLADILEILPKSIILAGRGIITSKTYQQFQAMIRKFNIYYFTTAKAVSLRLCSRDHYLGTIGLGGNINLQSLKKFSNLIILGSSLNELSILGFKDFFSHFNNIYQIDHDPNVLGKVYPSMHGLNMELNYFFHQFNSSQILLSDGENTVQENQLLKKEDLFLENMEPILPEHPEKNKQLKTSAFLKTVSGLMPDNTIYFADSGSSIPFSVHYLNFKNIESFHIPLSFAPMGWAIGAAIGGKIANPENPVVCITGDGSFLMEGMEMRTAVKYSLPVIFICLNNGIFNMIYHQQSELSGKTYYSSFPKIDIFNIAKSLGLESYNINSFSLITKDFIKKILNSKSPVFINVEIDPNEKIPYIKTSNIGKVEISKRS